MGITIFIINTIAFVGGCAFLGLKLDEIEEAWFGEEYWK